MSCFSLILPDEVESRNQPGPRLLSICSLAASLALVDDAGYSPPTPWEQEIEVQDIANVISTNNSSQPTGNSQEPEQPLGTTVRTVCGCA